jgi:hypothetical protein
MSHGSEIARVGAGRVWQRVERKEVVTSTGKGMGWCVVEMSCLYHLN